MSVAFVLVLIAAILSGLAAIRGPILGRGEVGWAAGFDLVAAAFCLFFVAVLIGVHA